MKKNIFLRVAVVLLAFSMFGLCTIPHTLGRYGGSFSIPGSSIRAGIFEVSIKKADGSWESIARGPSGTTFEIDLYETLYQEGGSPEHPGTILKTPPAGSPALIAPGCNGYFMIRIKNLSEVDVNWTLTAGQPTAEDGAGNPISMANQIEWNNNVGAGIWTWQNSFPGVTSPPAPLAPLGGTSSEGSYGYQWRWRYERGSSVNTWGYPEDVEDIALGVDGTVVYSLPLTVYAVQAD